MNGGGAMSVMHGNERLPNQQIKGGLSRWQGGRMLASPSAGSYRWRLMWSGDWDKEFRALLKRPWSKVIRFKGRMVCHAPGSIIVHSA